MKSYSSVAEAGSSPGQMQVAAILSEAGAEAIAVGTKAIEETHNYGEMRLVIDVRIPDEELIPLGERLRRLLGESELVRNAQPDEHADVTAWLLAPL